MPSPPLTRRKNSRTRNKSRKNYGIYHPFPGGNARGLDCREQVTSPTYTIVNEYLGGKLPLFHFDMYRLRCADDLFDIGWDDYLERGGVCAVEWSENVWEAMENPITVTIEKIGDNSRRITIEGSEKHALTGL